MQRNGLGRLKLRSRWGEVWVPAQRFICPASGCGVQLSRALDPDLDTSGWTPHALRLLVRFSSRLSFEEGSEALEEVGVKVSPAGLERLSHPYAEQHRADLASALSVMSERPLEVAPRDAAGQRPPGRVMVLQADGVIALGRAEGEGEAGCPGREIKQALVYPVSSPRKRCLVADVVSAREFEPLVHGLLRQAGVRQNDTLVGVGDGAAWVAGLFENAGAVRALDVYHATEYLETVMVALGWDETTRANERASWARGEVDGAQWLKDFDPGQTRRSSWGEEALSAWRYLSKHAASGAMAYPSFKAHGWPIGSGQIEGANKAVIGKRLKQAGMHWSREGMGGMACLRAQVCSNRPALDFHIQRHRAFLTH